ncbi:MAG: adenylyltransferase/sulfurtransferase [Cellvibrionaceae bacterium]|jgi:adenylyltransferase/sulfurtransferase
MTNKASSDQSTPQEFSSDEWLRYTRHLQLPHIGVEGQLRLKKSRVLIVGAGGLGSPVSLYLAAAGVGRITIIDGDTIDLTNLQRQILFTTEQVGQSKAECAKKQLLALNPEIDVRAIQEHLSLENAKPLIAGVDLVIDCTDNFSTRYLINDICVLLKKPWLFASIHQFSGQCALFTPLKTEASACFRCLFPEKPSGDLADCNTAGVMGVLPGLLGTLQANEALKFLVGLPCALENVLLLAEAQEVEFRKIQLSKNQECPLCSKESIELSEEDYVLLKSDAPVCSISDNDGGDEQDDNQDGGKGGGNENNLTADVFLRYVDRPEYYLLDVRSEKEHSSFNIGGENIPLSCFEREFEESLMRLDKNKIILCYCQTGVRSAKALVVLERHQFVAKHLKHGLVELLKANRDRLR